MISHKKAVTEGDTVSETFFMRYIDKNAMSTRNVEVSVFGAGTVLRLERDAWSMVK